MSDKALKMRFVRKSVEIDMLKQPHVWSRSQIGFCSCGGNLLGAKSRLDLIARLLEANSVVNEAQVLSLVCNSGNKKSS